MTGERFFVPSSAWGTELMNAAQPSFLPGETSPSWLDGAIEVRQVVMTVEPVLTLLYLAGYMVPEIVIGEGDAADRWVTFDPTDSRIRNGTVSWTAHTGTGFPGETQRAVAMLAAPMPHRQLVVGPTGGQTSLPIPIALTVAGTILGATNSGWIVLDLSPSKVVLTINTIRTQLLGPVVDAVTRFQSARTAATPPGLAGIYDPTNWKPVAPGGTQPSTAANDRVEALRRVTLRLTEGPDEWSNDNDPTTTPVVTAENVFEFLEPDIPQTARPHRNNQVLGWLEVADRVKERKFGVSADRAARAEYSTLVRYGGDPRVQSLTSTILDFHDRALVDVLAGFAAAPSADPCGAAAALAADTSHPLTAAAVELMCACLTAGSTASQDTVKGRLDADLANDYAAMYADADSRATIRASLIAACEAAPSHNPSLNANHVAAPEATASAEWFAGRLAAVLTSEPDHSAAGFDVGQYVNPLLEVADVWDRWLPLLDGRPTTPKLISITCDVFADTGHATVAVLAADHVMSHYAPGLDALLNSTGHHWTDSSFGSEFQGWGSIRAGIEGWREWTLVEMLAMLSDTHHDGELVHLEDRLIALVGPDPLGGYDVEAFEEKYGELLRQSTTRSSASSASCSGSPPTMRRHQPRPRPLASMLGAGPPLGAARRR